jgi:hypothetical protein
MFMVELEVKLERSWAIIPGMATINVPTLVSFTVGVNTSLTYPKKSGVFSMTNALLPEPTEMEAAGQQLIRRSYAQIIARLATMTGFAQVARMKLIFSRALVIVSLNAQKATTRTPRSARAKSVSDQSIGLMIQQHALLAKMAMLGRITVMIA